VAECCARYVSKARGCRRLLQSISLNITSAVNFASTRVYHSPFHQKRHNDAFDEKVNAF